MNRSAIISSIAQSLSRFKSEVEILNKVSLYDINLHSENVLIPFLNTLYDLNLVNANKLKKNYPGIDLIDSDNRVAFQITSTADNTKIKHTLKQVIENKIYLDVDFVYIYILTEKKENYKSEAYEEIIDGKISFKPKENIIDYSSVLIKIDSIIQASKLKQIEELLREEFTDDKINLRKKIADSEETLFKEDIYTNLLKVIPPQYIFFAELNIDRNEIITKSWETDFKLKKKASQRKVIMKALDFKGLKFIGDWHYIDNKIITFTDLFSSKNPLSKIIDVGTIERISVDDFITINTNYKNAFLTLLKVSINAKLYTKKIKWIDDENYYRFSIVGKTPGVRRIEWKLKNKATRAAVDEVWDKQHTRILCFKHIAFKAQLQTFNNNYYLAINPTWSYTWNGYEKSNLEKELLSGIKRLENNKSIYNVFRFVCYTLINKIEEEESYDLITFSLPDPMILTYII